MKSKLLARVDGLIAEKELLRPRPRAEIRLLNDMRAAIKGRPQIAKPGPQAPISLGEFPRVTRALSLTDQKIFDLIQSDPKHNFALIEIVAELKMAETTAKNCLTHLVRDGFITRPRRGFYIATTE